MDEYLHSFREMISLRGLTDHTLTSYCTYIRTYLPIKSGSVLHQGSSRYSTPGTRSCPTMYTCTASSPAAGLPRTENSADYGENIWHVFHHSMKATPWYFPLPAKACVILIPGKDFWTAFIKKNGALTLKRPLTASATPLSTWDVTPIRLPSPTAGFLTSPLLFGYTLPTIWACSELSPVRARPWCANIKK